MNSLKGKKILLITPYPNGKVGSQRFRFEMFLDQLKAEGAIIKQSAFFNEQTFSILYQSDHTFQKVFGTLLGFAKRKLDILKSLFYDYIFIHREATPFGPPFFEFIVAKIFRKKVIFDFDDAIWKKDIADANKLIAILKQPSKVEKICRWSSKVSAGNAYLAEYAKQYNDDSFIIPTIVDTDKQHNRLQNQNIDQVCIGWTGTNTTLKYLDAIVPVLKKLEEEYAFSFFVIADKNPDLPLKSFQFIPWKKETEIEDLLKFHIGLMPLNNEEWEKGKCGFKAIQYMALGIPAIATSIGVNMDIIEHGKNGYLVTSHEDWEKYITALITSEELRKSMGELARKKIENHYSKKSGYSDFRNLFIE
jgi:glycosyltransferase involved in cell wall biosynthesis